VVWPALFVATLTGGSYRRGVLASVVARAILLLVPLSVPTAPPRQLDPTVRHALHLLGPSTDEVIVLAAHQVRSLYARMGTTVPAGLTAFRIPGASPIYVNATSPVYADAAHDASPFNVLRLAATLLHERIHETDDEFAASRLQADFVRSRLPFLPRSERERAERYWRRLETRALMLALAERRLRR